jgi:hypothetical protein
MQYIDNNHYKITDKLAGNLARAFPSDTLGSNKLPAWGKMREVYHNGQKYWLLRTPYRYRVDSPKRGWVWALMLTR